MADLDAADRQFESGLQFYNSGDLAAAVEHWRRALGLNEGHHPARLHLGVCLASLGRNEDAKRELTIAAAASTDPTAALMLGRVFRAEKTLPAARRWFEQSLEQDPQRLETLHELGSLCFEMADYPAATGVYRKILKLRPNDAASLNNLCLALIRAQVPGEAAMELDSAADIVAADPALLRLRADVGIAIGDKAAAVSAHQKLLALHPENAASLTWLLTNCPEPEQRDEMRIRLQHLVRRTTSDPAAWKALAKNAYDTEGYEAAVAILDEGVARTNDASLLMSRALALPVTGTHAQLTAARSETEKTLDRLIGGEWRIANPVKSVYQTAFHLAYHGLNDRPILQKIAQAYLTVSPDLAWMSPHVGRRKGERGKIRIGFISSYLAKHSVGRMFGGFIEKLSSDHFEKIVIRPGGKVDALSERLNRAADAVISLPAKFEAARNAIAALELDVLFYADIGMDPFTYYMAFSRLAPVQMAWPGHPTTSGIPAIDSYVSSILLEREDYRDHYSETPQLLARIPSYFERVAKDVSRIDRAALGLPAASNLYVWPMTLQKFHPDFDAVVAKILSADPTGKFVFISQQSRWYVALLERLSAVIPDAHTRLIALPFLDTASFLALLQTADALLDSFHVSGANTSLDAFAYGVPVISRREKYMRGNFTSGMYMQMGMGDFVAASSDDYVARALQIANDRAYREVITKEICARNSVLYSDAAMVDELGQRIVDLHDAAMKRGG